MACPYSPYRILKRMQNPCARQLTYCGVTDLIPAYKKAPSAYSRSIVANISPVAALKFVRRGSLSHFESNAEKAGAYETRHMYVNSKEMWSLLSYQHLNEQLWCPFAITTQISLMAC
eukprot:6211067-Pleurochrysis_carterae.AAC.1